MGDYTLAGGKTDRNREILIMIFSLNLISWMSTTQSEKNDETKNRISGVIQKAIYDQFNEKVKTFMVNNYSETQMKTKPTKWRAIEISNRWTKPMESPASKPSPQIEPQKTRSSLRVNTSAFLFGTASIACHTTDKKTTSRRGYNSLFLWDTIYVPPTDKEKIMGENQCQ